MQGADGSVILRSQPRSGAPPLPSPLRFGPFEFDAVTGDLRRLDGAAAPRRLPPQPARLLALLIGRQGGLVSREEIRSALWPEARVDVDAGLHFCVRQVREALTSCKAVALVGPTTTAEDLSRLAADYHVAYVLNGRFLDAGQPPRMLAELIRVSDGTHVWVRSLAPPDDGRRLGLGIGREAAAALGLGEGVDPP